MALLPMAQQVPTVELEKLTSMLKEFLFFLLRLIVEIGVAYFVIRAAVSAALRQVLEERKFIPPPEDAAKRAAGLGEFVVNDEDEPAPAQMAERDPGD